MLELVGLEASLAGRFPHQLSGGRRHHVANARSPIANSSFVVFDEVIGAPDMLVVALILNLIKDIQDERGFAAFFPTIWRRYAMYPIVWHGSLYALKNLTLAA